MTHGELIRHAANWLRKNRYHSVLEDVRCNAVSEQPDVIGWRVHGQSAVIECKATLSDYRKDASKSHRRFPERGMGSLRYFAAPPAVARAIAQDVRRRGGDPFSVQGRWGVLSVGHKHIDFLLAPTEFEQRCHDAEHALLVAAVRRATEGWGRKMFGAEAPPLVDGDPHPSTSRIIRELREENDRLSKLLREATVSPRGDRS